MAPLKMGMVGGDLDRLRRRVRDLPFVAAVVDSACQRCEVDSDEEVLER